MTSRKKKSSKKTKKQPKKSPLKIKPVPEMPIPSSEETLRSDDIDFAVRASESTDDEMPHADDLAAGDDFDVSARDDLFGSF